jgi:hypothetical protein
MKFSCGYKIAFPNLQVGAFYIQKGETNMLPQLKADIQDLLSYVVDDEASDFREHLLSEDYIEEEGILSEEELETLYDNCEPEKVEAILEKARKNPKMNHIYCTICRISENI